MERRYSHAADRSARVTLLSPEKAITFQSMMPVRLFSTTHNHRSHAPVNPTSAAPTRQPKCHQQLIRSFSHLSGVRRQEITARIVLMTGALSEFYLSAGWKSSLLKVYRALLSDGR